MKTKTIKLTWAIVAIMLTLNFAACRKIKNEKDTDTTMSQDNAMGEFVFNDVSNIADDASEVNSGDNLTNYKTASNCATVTKDTLAFPKTITIDFGPNNCLCADGRYRKGKILISYTGKYRDSGSVHTITFDDYHVNNNKIMGSKTVQNMGLNTNNQSYFNITVNGLIIKANTGDSVTWNSNRVRTWLQGESTQTWLDDVYQITGSGSGQRANGTQYTMTIINPLVKAKSCNWIQQGKVDIQPTGGNLRTIDYGNGNCDDQATVTIGGSTFNITLN